MSLFVTDGKDRCEILGEYIAENGGTVRNAAAVFGVSKSTVHKDVTEKLSVVSKGLYERVRKVLDENKAERHIRGGEATKKKYLTKKNKLSL